MSRLWPTQPHMGKVELVEWILNLCGLVNYTNLAFVINKKRLGFHSFPIFSFTCYIELFQNAKIENVCKLHGSEYIANDLALFSFAFVVLIMSLIEQVNPHILSIWGITLVNYLNFPMFPTCYLRGYCTLDLTFEDFVYFLKK